MTRLNSDTAGALDLDALARLGREPIDDNGRVPSADLTGFFQSPELQSRAAELGLAEAAPETTRVEPDGDAGQRLLAASVNATALEDELFQGAPTDVAKLRRLNQIRRRFELGELGTLPDELLPVGAGEELGKQFATGRGLAEKVPFAGGIATAALDLATIIPAARRVDSGEETEEDLETLAAAVERAVEQRRPRTLAGRATQIASQIPTFGAEFGATFGAGALARKGATKAAAKVAGKAIGDVVEKTLARKGIKGLTDVTAQVAALGGLKLLPETVKRVLPEVRNVTDQELVVVPGEAALTAMKNAGFDLAVEVVSERSGVAIAGVGRWLTKPIRKLVKAPELSFTTRQFLGRIGFQGPVTEVLEEREGELIRQAATDLGLVDLPQSTPTVQQVLSELLAFTLPLAGGVAADVRTGRLLKDFEKAAQQVEQAPEVSRETSGATEAEARVTDRATALRRGGLNAEAARARAETEIRPQDTKAQLASFEAPAARFDFRNSPPEADTSGTDVVFPASVANRVGSLLEQHPELGRVVEGDRVRLAQGVTGPDFVERFREGESVPPPAQPSESAETALAREVQAGRLSIPEVEEAQAQTSVEGLRAFAPGVPKPRGTPVDRSYLPEEVRRRVDKGEGLRRPPIHERVRKWTGRQAIKMVRAQLHLPVRDERWASGRQFFRLMKDVTTNGSDEAVRHVAAVVSGMSTEDAKLFRDFLLARNQLSALDQGQPLREGWESREQVEQSLQAMRPELDARPAVRDALETRKRLNTAVVERLVQADLLPEGAIENVEDYFHQQVIAYAELDRLGSTTTRGDPAGRRAKASFQKKRFSKEGVETLPEEFDYNTSFVEAESRWLTDAYTKLGIVGLFENFVKRVYDKRPQLVEKANAAREAGEQDAKWSDFIPEGFTTWYPQPGNIVFSAVTIPERIGERLWRDEIESAEIDKDDLKRVLAIGAPRTPLVIPNEMAAQLDEMTTANNVLGRADRFLMRLWKQYLLLAPQRVAAYNLRNVTGDYDAVIAGAVPIRGTSGQAIRELLPYYQGEIAMPEPLRAARDLSVINSSMAARELPALENVKVLRRFLSKRRPLHELPVAAVQKYFEVAHRYTEFRENMLRYSVFLSYRNMLAKERTNPGALKHFGNSTKGDVLALMREQGTDVAAAKMARDLLGDYGNLSIFGNWMRAHVFPFWSWQEINLHRVPRLTANALSAGDFRAATAIPVSALRLIMLSRLAWMYGAFWSWNNLFNRQKESELTFYDQSNPHMVVCRFDDGSIRTFRNVGMLGDAMEWFGLNSMLSLLPQLENNSLTWGELIDEMRKDPVNKVYSGIRPDVKILLEAGTGLSFFPDIGSPRPQPPGELAAANLGLRDAYRAARGAIEKNGLRARPHSIARVMVGVADPQRNALNEMYSLRDRYLARIGKERGIFPRSEFAVVRESLMNGDFEAYKEAMVAFARSKIQQGQNIARSYVGSVRRLDPIDAALNATLEREFEQNFLGPLQRQRLRVARDYAQELAVLAKQWFRRFKPELRRAVAD